MILFTFIGVVAILISLPISDAIKGQIFSLLGIIISAAIALSSTTFVGNAMAGLMLTGVRVFKIGDFIRVGDHFGRVSERGLLHVELQTEDRDLTTLPNLYLVTNPTKVIHAEGTVISVDVSLGYDINRKEIERYLIAAAETSNLESPFVQVISLGDFSVLYRVSGLLLEVKKIITARSELHKNILDSLQDGGIEIVSPTFMNTRSFNPKQSFIAPTASHTDIEEKSNEEIKIFGDNNKEVISFNIDEIHPYDIGSILDKLGIAVRTGHHCAQPIMDFYKIPGTIRASFSFYNTKEEIDILVEGVKRAKMMLS